MNSLTVIKSDIQWYMDHVNSFPVLSADDQLVLAKKVYHDNCNESAKILIEHNLRLVLKIALEFKGYNLPLIDLVQEGSIGLMIAIRKFDPYREVKLISYASHWIKAYIRKYVMDNYSLVKIGVNEEGKRLFWKGEHPEDDSLNIPVSTTFDSVDRLDVVESHYPNQEELYLTNEEQAQIKLDIREAVDCLTEKQKIVAYYRFMSDEQLTLQEISDMLNISRERVRQLELAVVVNLKKYLSEKYK
jgi:RNA polymerase sigma-32 factor